MTGKVSYVPEGEESTLVNNSDVTCYVLDDGTKYTVQSGRTQTLKSGKIEITIDSSALGNLERVNLYFDDILGAYYQSSSFISRFWLMNDSKFHQYLSLADSNQTLIVSNIPHPCNIELE